MKVVLVNLQQLGQRERLSLGTFHSLQDSRDPRLERIPANTARFEDRVEQRVKHPVTHSLEVSMARVEIVEIGGASALEEHVVGDEEKRDE